MAKVDASDAIRDSVMEHAGEKDAEIARLKDRLKAAGEARTRLFAELDRVSIPREVVYAMRRLSRALTGEAK